MKYIDYEKWRDQHLRHAYVTVDQYEVSYWASKIRPDAPTILLVHGITGDHNGLMALAKELWATHNVVLLDLPGHGDSQMRPIKNTRDFRDWFDHAFFAVVEKLGPIEFIIAHSFGCSAALRSSRAKIVLLCPVPLPSRLYRQYARITMRLAPFWALFYNWRIFVLMRGASLRKVHTRDARRRVRWAGLYSPASYRQIVYQAGLIDIILDREAYDTISPQVKLVIAGLEDTTAQQRDSAELEVVFGTVPVKFLRGGHLLPIESPDAVAHQIESVL
ncbi:MAG: alpha/beta hydrolase [Candidatus Saccharibacteria bacterium]